MSGIATVDIDAEIESLGKLNEEQGAVISRLLNRLNVIENEVMGKEQISIVELRDISENEARGEIVDLLRDGKGYDVGEIADELKLDISLVVNVCNALIDEGTIGE